MMRKPSKSVLAKALHQRKAKHASSVDPNLSAEGEGEFEEDEAENTSDVEDNIFEILENFGINTTDTILNKAPSNSKYIIDGG